jgi:nucleoside-diphosphate kinase
MQNTLGIIKPDAVAKGYTGKIIDLVLEEGLTLGAMKMVHLTRAQAAGFYDVHKDKGFFNDLLDFMTSGPVVLMLLQGDDAITRWRTLMGATNPANAAEGTLRKLFAASIQNNAVHGSDAPETADYETRYFFNVFDRV